MKKLFLLGLLYLCCLAILHADLLLPLNAGNVFSGETITHPVVMKNRAGSLYLFYIENGDLSAMKSSDEGSTLAPVELTDLGFSAVKGCTLQAAETDRPFLIVEATRNHIQGLYALIFNENNAPAVAFDNPLSLTSAGGAVTGYSLVPGDKADFILLYLKGNRLYATFFSFINNTVTRSTLSAENETVTDYRFHIYFPATGLAGYGLYFTEADNNLLYHYFEVQNKALTGNEVIYQQPAAVPAAYELFKSNDAATHFHYLTGNSLYGKKRTAGSWSALNNGEAMTVFPAEGTVLAYYLDVPKGRTFTGFAVTVSGNTNLYLAGRNADNTLKAFGENTLINAAPVTGTPVILPVYGNAVIAAYLQPAEGKNPVSTALGNNGSLTPVTCTGQLTGTQAVTAFALHITRDQKLVLYEKLDDGGSTVVQFYRFSGLTEGFVKQLTLNFPAAEGAISAIKAEKDLCLIGLAAKTVLVNLNSWQTQTIATADLTTAGDTIKTRDYLVRTTVSGNWLYAQDQQAAPPVAVAAPDEIIQIIAPMK